MKTLRAIVSLVIPISRWNRTFWFFFLAAFILYLVITVQCLAQAQIGPPAPIPTYEPTELQQLKLENERYKLIIIALQIAPLEQQRKEQLATLNQLCETIRKENKWPEDIKCDLTTLKFQKHEPRPQIGPRGERLDQPKQEQPKQEKPQKQ
jgi:hypothetical protein